MAIARTSRLRRFHVSTILAAAALGAAALGCSKKDGPATEPQLQASAQPVTGGTFHVASIGEPSNLLPPLATDSASFDIIGQVYNTLIKYNGKYEFEGDLAERWEVLDSGLRFRFYLRKNIKFHDGHPCTARDVIQSYKIMTDPRTPTAYAVNYTKIKSVTAIDDYTVDVSYTESHAPALDDLASLHILPGHLVTSAEKIAEHPLNRKPIGTGPYMFVEWQSNVKITLKANPDYFLGRPNIEGFEYRIIPDQQTIFLELKTGHLDRGGLTPLQWERQTNTPDIQKLLTKYEWTGLNYTYLGFNLKREPFADKRVRHALNYAINRTQIIDGVLMGHGKPLYGPMPPDLWYSNPNLPTYPYDPAKAKALLAEAGFKDTDGDGILDRNGSKFSFEVITNQGNPLREQTAQIMQANFKDLGIDMQIRVVEWSAFLEKFVDTRNFDAIILGWALGPEPDQYNFWHSSQTGKKQFNFVGYNNPRVDELLEISRRTVEREARKKALYELQSILAEDAPYAWLFTPDSLAVVHTRIRGVEKDIAGIGHNFEHWWIPAPMQAAIP